MSEGYVLAIDQGTTGTTVVMVDSELRVVARATEEFPQSYPRPGWVEHDPDAIWASVLAALDRTLVASGVSPNRILGIGITNQRETTIVWNRAAGRPIYPAIVWQDRRTAEFCAELTSDERQNVIHERTGLVVDPYFSASKVRWILENVPLARNQANRGELAFGTVDSFLLGRLCGPNVHITDVTNASRTSLFNIEKLCWDDELLAMFSVPRSLLPRVVECSELYGVTKDVPGLPDGIPVCGSAGDQQAALFGQACFAKGDAKCTYGTGAFLLVNTGQDLRRSRCGALTTIAWKLRGQVSYALEGSVFVAGAAIQWLRDGLGVIKAAAEVEELAKQVEDSGGVHFVPAFTGLGAPHWRPHARGLITGLTRGTKAAHLARAALDGIAYQVADLVNAIVEESGERLTVLKVDGGAAQNNLLMQIQSDILGFELIRPPMVEATALGAAGLAGLAVGLWPDCDAIQARWRAESRFVPALDVDARCERMKRWREAVALA